MGEHPDVEKHQQNDKHPQPRPSDGTVGLAPFDKNSCQGNEEQRVTRIGHTDAPRVAGDIELDNDQRINPIRRHNNYKYICTQHRSTSIYKANANKYERGN